MTFDQNGQNSISHSNFYWVILKTTLLGAPIGQKSEISAVEANLGDLKRTCHRLEKLPAHVAFFLLYMFRTAPVDRKLYELTKFDTEIRQTLERIINIEMNDPRWELLSLPCKLGGVGILQAPLWIP